ncbi:MAG: MerR family transcriptional regulator, partial [Nitratireductor sp.]
MDKSPDAFRTISEVAEDLDLPQHVLRFWETRFTQIKPMKRGGGRRYYRPQDVDLIKGIKRMLYDQGYTIKGVQKLLRENGVQFVAAIGAGDLAAAEAITKRKQAEAPPQA